MNNKEKYDEWVKKVCDFLAEEGPILKRHCATFQSKPIFDKQADVVFLGYNPQEDWGYYEEDSQPTRFYEGNPSFYENNGKERMKWKIWKKLYDALKWAEYTKPVEDGNFVFFNAVYFGSKTINDWGNTPVYGIPHPSSHISNDHWGLIALYLRGEMEKLGI